MPFFFNILLLQGILKICEGNLGDTGIYESVSERCCVGSSAAVVIARNDANTSCIKWPSFSCDMGHGSEEWVFAISLERREAKKDTT